MSAQRENEEALYLKVGVIRKVGSLLAAGFGGQGCPRSQL
jgi:hypothetical protein